MGAGQGLSRAVQIKKEAAWECAERVGGRRYKCKRCIPLHIQCVPLRFSGQGYDR